MYKIHNYIYIYIGLRKILQDNQNNGFLYIFSPLTPIHWYILLLFTTNLIDFFVYFVQYWFCWLKPNPDDEVPIMADADVLFNVPPVSSGEECPRDSEAGDGLGTTNEFILGSSSIFFPFEWVNIL